MSQMIKINNKHEKRVAGWNQFVKPLQDQANFWHAIWISAGKPLNTELHKIMKNTRNKYHYRVRKCREAQTMLKNIKIVGNCFENDADIFSEMRKSRQTKSDVTVIVDGKCNDEIPNAFGKVYGELLNSINDKQNIDNMPPYYEMCITVYFLDM